MTKFTNLTQVLVCEFKRKYDTPILINMIITVMFVDRPYLGPIIAGAVGKDVAIVVEAASCDWLIKLFRGFQLCASILIPETKATVRAHCGQRAVYWMESNGIDLG